MPPPLRLPGPILPTHCARLLLAMDSIKQVTGSVDMDGSDGAGAGGGGSGGSVPALGLSWASCVNVRVLVSRFATPPAAALVSAWPAEPLCGSADLRGIPGAPAAAAAAAAAARRGSVPSAAAGAERIVRGLRVVLSPCAAMDRPCFFEIHPEGITAWKPAGSEPAEAPPSSSEPPFAADDEAHAPGGPRLSPKLPPLPVEGRKGAKGDLL